MSRRRRTLLQEAPLHIFLSSYTNPLFSRPTVHVFAIIVRKGTQTRTRTDRTINNNLLRCFAGELGNQNYARSLRTGSLSGMVYLQCNSVTDCSGGVGVRRNSASIEDLVRAYYDQARVSYFAILVTSLQLQAYLLFRNDLKARLVEQWQLSPTKTSLTGRDLLTSNPSAERPSWLENAYSRPLFRREISTRKYRRLTQFLVCDQDSLVGLCM